MLYNDTIFWSSAIVFSVFFTVSAVMVSLGAKRAEVVLLVTVPFLFGVLDLICFSFLRAERRLSILQYYCGI